MCMHIVKLTFHVVDYYPLHFHIPESIKVLYTSIFTLSLLPFLSEFDLHLPRFLLRFYLRFLYTTNICEINNLEQIIVSQNR